MVIDVHNDGDGIPEYVRGNLFEPVFETKEEDTGLGLSIAKQIVKAHGGKLTCNFRESDSPLEKIVSPIGRGLFIQPMIHGPFFALTVKGESRIKYMPALPDSASSRRQI